MVLVYYVCLYLSTYYIQVLYKVFVFVHSFLQILAGKLEVGVENQVGDQAVDHGRR